jgi:hypothetical protein
MAGFVGIRTPSPDSQSHPDRQSRQEDSQPPARWTEQRRRDEELAAGDPLRFALAAPHPLVPITEISY